MYCEVENTSKHLRSSSACSIKKLKRIDGVKSASHSLDNFTIIFLNFYLLLIQSNRMKISCSVSIYALLLYDFINYVRDSSSQKSLIMVLKSLIEYFLELKTSMRFILLYSSSINYYKLLGFLKFPSGTSILLS